MHKGSKSLQESLQSNRLNKAIGTRTEQAHNSRKAKILRAFQHTSKQPVRDLGIDQNCVSQQVLVAVVDKVSTSEEQHKSIDSTVALGEMKMLRKLVPEVAPQGWDWVCCQNGHCKALVTHGSRSSG